MKIFGLTVIAILCTAAQVQAAPTIEMVRAGGMSAFQASVPDAAPVVTLTLTAPAAAAKKGTRLNVTVEKIFDEDYEARQLPGVDLRIRRQNHFPGRLARFEATGDLFGQRLDFGSPLILESDVFGSRRTIRVEGAGMDLELERLSGWGQMDVRVSLDQKVRSESIAVLHGLLACLPELGMSSALGASEKKQASDKRTGYRFEEFGHDRFLVRGDGVDLSVSVREVGFEDREYEVTGEAFGKRLSFGDLTVRTDKAWLGPRGYRVQGMGADFEVKRDDFGGRKRIEVRGTAGDSPRFAVLILSLVQYAFSR